MMKKQLAIVVIALLALAACGSSGKPQSFYEQRGPLKEDYKPYAAELLGATRILTMCLLSTGTSLKVV